MTRLRTQWFFKVLLVSVLALALCIPYCLVNHNVALAVSARVSITQNEQIGYAGYSTCHVTDNETGYALICAQPDKSTPANGTYDKDYNWTDDVASSGDADLDAKRIEMIERVFYYGHPDSPGFDASFWPSTWYDGGGMGYGKYIALTHVALSDLYANDLAHATFGCDPAFTQWFGTRITGGYSGGIAVSEQDRASSVYGIMYNDATGDDWLVPAGFTLYRISTGSSSQVMFGIDAVGYIALNKSSNNPAMTDNNKAYSLAGAEYTVYADSSCSRAVCTLITDDSGYAKSEAVNTGTYYIKETKAPQGFVINEAVSEVTVSCGQTSTVPGTQLVETAQNDAVGLLLQKVDAESHKASALGKATLADAEFTLCYFDNLEGDTSGQAKYTWVFKTNASGAINFQDPDTHFVSGDELFHSSTGAYALPLGTYTLQETKAPEGYNLQDSPIVSIVAATGKIEQVDGWNLDSFQDQVKRGDLRFEKKESANGTHLANIVFKLTSETTGESHLIMTDENGEFCSQSRKALHTYKTNANDEALNEDGTVDESKLDPHAGVWFAQCADGTICKADDSLCALPYDTYTLEELSTSANKNMSLVCDSGITISNDSMQVDIGTITDIVGQTPVVETVVDNPKGKSVSTGDYCPYILLLAIMAIISAAAIVVLKNRIEHNRKRRQRKLIDGFKR